MLSFSSLKKGMVLLAVVIMCAGLSSAKSPRKPTQKRPASTAARSKRSSVSLAKKGRKRLHARKSSRTRGQQAIDRERAREIQEALIRANYLEGEATGLWDQRTKEALSRFQRDNGWQTKIIPDSRALIKLGLGPKQADLINPTVQGNSFTSHSPDPETARGDMRAGPGVQP